MSLITDYITDKFQSVVNDLCIVQLNVHGIGSKQSSLQHLIDNCISNRTPDVVVLSETWLTPFSPTIKVPGYEFCHKDRTSRRGGGVGLLISERIRYKIIQHNHTIGTTFVQVLTSKQSKLQQKIISMEQRLLENAVVFRGIPEDMNETDYSMREKIYQEISFTLEGESPIVKMAMAKNMVIKRCKRVGRFSQTRARPITVEFLQCQDVEYIIENKNFLQRGIYVDREYVPEIERK